MDIPKKKNALIRLLCWCVPKKVKFSNCCDKQIVNIYNQKSSQKVINK